MRFNICSPTCYSSVFFIHFLLLLLIYRANADVAVPITEPKITYDGFQVIRIDIQNNLALVEGLIEELELPTWGGALQENRFVDAVIPPENREEVISTLEGDGVEFVYLHEDLGASISAQEEYPEYSRDLIKDGSWFDTYHSFDDHRRFFWDLAQLYPHNTQIFSIGDSVEGRPLVGMRIFRNQDEHKPAVVFHGTTHAREWISPAVVEYAAYSLLVDQSLDSDMQEYLDDFDFYIFQIVNPDGFLFTKTTDRLWRKNRQVVNETSGCVGIDTNRNWPAFWDAPQGSSDNPCSNLYRGTEAAQAPEIAAQVSFLSHLAQKLKDLGGIKLYIDFHSYGQQLGYPYGYDCNVIPPTLQSLDAVGRAAAQAIDVATPNSPGLTDYEVDQTCEIYNISGGSADWVYENGAGGGGGMGTPTFENVHHGEEPYCENDDSNSHGNGKANTNRPLAYLFELRDDGESEEGGFGFVLPKEQIRISGEETMAGVKKMLRESI